MTKASPLEAARDWLGSGALVAVSGRVLAAIAIVGATYLLVQTMQAGLKRLRRRAKAGSSLIYIVEKIVGYAMMVAGLIAGLATLGVDLNSFTVFAGAIGVGAGLGLQGVVKEFVSGLVLIFDPAIQVGDFIELESGLRGEVVEIGPRATRMRTNDDLNVVIPNSRFVQSQVLNWTYNNDTGRIHVAFSVSEDADKAVVRDVVMAAAHALPFTAPDRPDRKTQVWMTSFSGDGLDFELVVWPTMESSRHPSSMRAAYTWAVHEALRAAGIDNSSPQLDLRLRSLFGQEGDHALHALEMAERRRSAPREPVANAPNDAARAVFDDAIRSSRAREAEPRRREKQA